MKRNAVIGDLDWLTILVFLVLIAMGWLNIFSAVYSGDYNGILDIDQRYGKQFLWICASIIIAVGVLSVNSRFFEFFSYPVFGLMMLLLVLVLFIGKEVNASKSWFIIGSLQIQPSEFAKPAVALALARYLSTYNLNVKSLKSLITAGSIFVLPAGLILLQPDAGSALVFFTFILVLYREGFSWTLLLTTFFLLLLFFLVLILPESIILMIIIVSGALIYLITSGNTRYFIRALLIYSSIFGLILGVTEIAGFKHDLYKTGLLSLGFSIPLFLILIYLHRIRKSIGILAGIAVAVVYSFGVDYGFHNFLNEYQQHRINIMLGITSDPLGAGYNVNQSKIAIGSGGFSGKGFLEGTQTKLSFVPEQSTDFIFCTVGEEWGFIGTVTVLGLFTFLLARLIILAERQRTVFSRIYGYGVFSVLFFHVVINISMTVGLFPVIGIPLPFFSYGGSSLWAFTILLFIFLRLDASRKEYIL